jgi:CheY-like chemotaxis protein
MELDYSTILLVEDNEDDVFIFQRVYQRARLPYALHVVRDGKEALDFLLGQESCAPRARRSVPFLTLLDLKLPSKSGLDVLQAIRSEPELARVCVVVLTSSAESRDIARAHELGAQAFLVKPPTEKTIGAVVAAAIARARAPNQRERLRIEGDMFAAALM